MTQQKEVKSENLGGSRSADLWERANAAMHTSRQKTSGWIHRLFSAFFYLREHHYQNNGV